jgi:hypothetical protein
MEESDQVPLTLAGARTGRRSAQLSRSRVGRWLWVVLLPLPFLLRQLLAANPAWVENYYTRRIFPALSAPWRFMTNLLPFSLTEMAVLALPIALLVFVFFLVRSGRRRQLGRFLRRSGLVAGWLAACLVWQFMLLHGFNYVREPAAESLGLPVRNRSSAEVGEALLWTSRQAARARLSCQEDDAGVFTLSQSIPVTLQRGEAGYARAGQIWPSLEIAPPARPKPVLLSHAWSYTGITGLYNPIWVGLTSTSTAGVSSARFCRERSRHYAGFAREVKPASSASCRDREPGPDYRYSSMTMRRFGCCTAWRMLIPNCTGRLMIR